ncbi:hypothetical protein Purlil1_9142 [Purpureocillium lilacinum]|uniref:CorA-like transporter domain-containing protein n=1 Tax=Purpureocillium lilacinum TaxID=33203 RepID=A0ABR0BRG4_PURLI|nr:hypothetical protein Purlil1_9142 [Purpureocillium lilacinum]
MMSPLRLTGAEDSQHTLGASLRETGCGCRACYQEPLEKVPGQRRHAVSKPLTADRSVAETTLEQEIATLVSPSDPAVECQPHKKQGGCQRLIRLGLHRRITHMHTKCIAPSLTWPKKAAELPRPRHRLLPARPSHDLSENWILSCFERGTMAEAQQVTQNVCQRYLKKDSLQTVLERLFPGQTDFRIRLREDQWCFTAPRTVTEAEIEYVVDTDESEPSDFWDTLGEYAPGSDDGSGTRRLHLKHIQRLVPPSCSLPRIDSKKQCPVRCTPIHHKMDPTSGDRCLVDEVLEPVQLRDVVVGDTPHIRSQSFRDAPSLEAYLEDDTNQDYSCRFISVCQRNSWRPLQITRAMMSAMINAHDLSPSLWNVASCFYTRNLDLEDAFCVPLTLSTTGPWIEISYTIRYPEFKEADKEWTMRQSGVCHRVNTETRQSVFILLNPKPNAKGQLLIEKHLSSRIDGRATDGLLSMHQVLLSGYLPAWRQYIASYEAQFLPMANSTFATYIDEPLRLGYDHLISMVNLENRFNKTISLLAATIGLVSDLHALLNVHATIPASSDDSHTGIVFDNHARQCAAFSRTATYLQQRVQTAAQLLANTLSFRDQVIAKEQSGNMLQLNKSAVFITTLTLIYAPASFAAVSIMPILMHMFRVATTWTDQSQTFFGMNFFAMDQPNSRIICTSMIWIYLVATVVITGLTVVFYYWLIQHDGVLFWRLAPKVKVNADWRALARRLTKLDQNVELRDMYRSV